TWRGPAGLGAGLHLGRRAVSVDLAARQITDDLGATYGYERLLLATGGRPRRLPGSGEDDGIVYFRHLPDYRRLRSLADGGASFIELGGGVIGRLGGAELRGDRCDDTIRCSGG